MQIPRHDAVKAALLLQGEMMLDLALIRFERIEEDIAGGGGFLAQRATRRRGVRSAMSVRSGGLAAVKRLLHVVRAVD